MKNYKILVVNLKKRNDRRNTIIKLFNDNNINNYYFYDAIDGYNIELTLEIKNLFTNNDFGNRKGFIGCGLSHYNIWLDLIKDKENDYYIVFEDDILFNTNFKKRFEVIKQKIDEDYHNIDIIFTGFHKDKNMIDFDSDIDGSFSFIPFDKNLFWIGGTFGYVITKTGALNMIQYIQKNNIKHGIDYVMKLINTDNVLMCKPSLVLSDWYESSISNTDTDIQKDYNAFDFSSLLDYHNYIFLKEVDQYGNDIHSMSNNNLNLVLDQCNNLDDLSIGFNTYGYIKSHISEIKILDYMKNTNNGIYLKLDKKYRVKVICNWCDNLSLCNELNNMSKNNFTWNNIKIIPDDNNVDYYIIINKSFNQYYDPKKTIIFQMEPRCDAENQFWGTKSWGEWSNPDESKFLYVGVHNNYLNNCTWQISYSYDYLNNNYIEKKYNNYLSTICSDKYIDTGHKIRINLLKYIEFKTDKSFELDVYGNINSIYIFKNNKGILPMNIKEYGISPYKYYFMIENNFEKNYITEKLWEPIICECLCFYYGAPNVTEYINPDAFVLLDINDFEKSYQIIDNAIKEDWWSKRIDIIRKEKYKILNYYNFFPRIERIITKKIWEDKLNILKNKFEIFILSKLQYSFNYKIDIFKKTMEDFNIKVSYYENNNIISFFIKIYNLYKNIIKNSNNSIIDNYLILEDDYKYEGSINNLFNHIMFLPDDYDVCQLYENQNKKWKLVNQINSLYYEIKKFPFICKGVHIISKKGLNKIIEYMNIIIETKNYIKMDYEKMFYDLYEKNENFKFYVSKNNFIKF